MKSSETENNRPAKPRSCRSWIVIIMLILGLPLLFYYGYCWGIWGRNSLLLQYLFQCNCPPASEEARYSDDVDVIVSACSHVSTILSPSGRLVFIREKDSGLTFDYLLDLQTGNELPFPIPENGGFYFLTDDLLYISSSYDENYVLDRTTGNQYPIQRFSSLRSDAYIGGHANLILLAETLRQAKYVFFREYDDTIVALAPDFPTSVENNFVLNRFGIPGENPNRTEQFLKENNIVYHIIPAAFPGEVISPDGRFVAREDGIYIAETNQKVVDGISSSVRGWAYDNRAVIYSRFRDPCLIRTNFLIFDDYACYFEVPQPVIKLKVPEEYLSPEETP